MPVFPQTDPPKQGRDNAGMRGVCSAVDSRRVYSLSHDGQGLDPGLTQETLLLDTGRSGVELLQIKGSRPREAPIYALCFLCGFGWGSSESGSMLREGSRGASPAQVWLPVGDLWDSPFWLVSNHLEAVQEGRECTDYSSQIPLLSAAMSDASWDT